MKRGAAQVGGQTAPDGERALKNKVIGALLHPSSLILHAFLLALLPRVLGLNDFLTTDEAYHWVVRVEAFSYAVGRGDWAGTILTGHPGVTIMWLGSLGLALERLAVGQGWVPPPLPVEHLAWLRLPGALLEALFVPLGYLLLRRLVAPATALIAALLWAASPYLIAHARLLHLDGLLTGFVTLSVLLLLAAAENREPRTENRNSASGSWFLVLGSGVCAGLALLTKGPALILLPVVGMVVIGDWGLAIREQRSKRGPIPNPQSPIPNPLALYLLWLAAALLTVLLLWPGLWAAPGMALGRYVGEISANGGRPNGDGQFFLGRAVDDPGPLFYPLANVWRMTPGVLVGLLFYFGFWTRSGSKIQNRNLLALLIFVLFWTVVMTLGPKKFDRYVLPTWPALLVLAAAGLGRVYELRAMIDDRLGKRLPFVTLALGLLLAIELAQPLWYHPYYLSYYNPLLGGGAVAQRALLIGWGEGMDRVGAALRARPDIGHGPVLAALGQTLQPFVPVPVKDVTELGAAPANYAVVYLESLQRAAHPALYASIQQTQPLARISIHGIEYAAIYQLPRPFARAVGATFGGALHLRGVSLERAPGQVVVQPAWDVRAPAAANYTLFLHLIDANGTRVAQADVAPGGDGPPTGAWQPGQQLDVPIILPLPADLPPGSYRLVLGLYDASGARVPFTGGTPADPALAGADAVLADILDLPP